MKHILIFLCLWLTISSYSQTQDMMLIEGDYQQIKITGSVQLLNVQGVKSSKNKLSISGPPDLVQYYSTTSRGKKLHIVLDAEAESIFLKIPKSCDLIIEPKSVAFEGEDYWTNARKIIIKEMDGSVSVEADGYEIELTNNSNSMNIVSYMDIFADSIIVGDGHSILFDSYLGNVDLHVQPPIDALFTLEALEGITLVDSLLYFDPRISELDQSIMGQVGEGKSSILLHSEKGDLVQLHFEDLQEKMIEIEDINLLQSRGEIVVIQHKPNPWNRVSEIIYIMPKAAEITFTIFNKEGKQVMETALLGEKGVNKYKIKRKDLGGGGEYLCKIKSGNFEAEMSINLSRF